MDDLDSLDEVGYAVRSKKFDEDRYEQELIYYIEKLDISEEKVRLKAHCDYFLKTIEDEQFKGKSFHSLHRKWDEK